MRLPVRVAASAILAAAPATAVAQHDHSSSAADTARAPGAFAWRRVEGRVGLMAIGVVTRVTPAFGGDSFTEGYLTQPNLMGEVWWRAVRFTGTLNAEGYTLRRGELTPGIYGEGYVDRRHPHTLLHEALLSVGTNALRPDGLAASLSAGKGFAPYGTDDPMMRPFVKYPVNHHHAQILERLQVTGALRWAHGERDVTLEGGLFNGDEPNSPFDAPRVTRVGDSRALRLTVRPLRALELQASAAHVESPAITQGGAADHEQRSASARFDGTAAGGRARVYALAEYARTEETEHDDVAFRYESVLAEAQVSFARLSAAVRYERTDRPEEERLLDPFRTPVGHIDFQILGITRWSTTTAQLAVGTVTLPRQLGAGRLVPFLEVARSVPSAVVLPTVFEPRAFYGGSTLWTYSVGVRLHTGQMRSRMGRYGVALPRSLRGADTMSPSTPMHHQ